MTPPTSWPLPPTPGSLRFALVMVESNTACVEDGWQLRGFGMTDGGSRFLGNVDLQSGCFVRLRVARFTECQAKVSRCTPVP